MYYTKKTATALMALATVAEKKKATSVGRPACQVVNVSVDASGHTHAWATDTYRLAIYDTSDYDTENAACAGLSFGADARELADALKGSTMGTLEVVEMDGHQMLKVYDISGKTSLVRLYEGRAAVQLESARDLMPHGKEPAPVSLNPSYLASLCKVAERIYGKDHATAFELHAYPTPSVMTAADSTSILKALVMPIRPKA